MHITLTINLETRDESAEQMRRLAYLFGGPLEQPYSVDESPITRTGLIVQPDANCFTLPNGDCVSTVDCMHGPAALTDHVVAAPPWATLQTAVTEAQEPPAKKTRKPRGVQTPLPTTTGEASGPTDLAAALDTALDAMPGVTELTDTVTDPERQALMEDVLQSTLNNGEIGMVSGGVMVVATTLEQEVTAVEDKVAPASMEEGTFDLLADETVVDELVVSLDEPVVLPELPAVDDMDLAAAGAEIRRLVIKNTGAWLRDMLNHYKVGRISELSLDQSHDAIRSGRVRAGEVKA